MIFGDNYNKNWEIILIKLGDDSFDTYKNHVAAKILYMQEEIGL